MTTDPCADYVAVECWYCEEPLLSRDAVRWTIVGQGEVFDAHAHPACKERHFDREGRANETTD